MTRDSAPAPKTGDPAPTLELPALDGSSYTLSDRPGAPVLVSFLRHAG